MRLQELLTLATKPTLYPGYGDLVTIDLLEEVSKVDVPRRLKSFIDFMRCGMGLFYRSSKAHPRSNTILCFLWTSPQTTQVVSLHCTHVAVGSFTVCLVFVVRYHMRCMLTGTNVSKLTSISCIIMSLLIVVPACRSSQCPPRPPQQPPDESCARNLLA